MKNYFKIINCILVLVLTSKITFAIEYGDPLSNSNLSPQEILNDIIQVPRESMAKLLTNHSLQKVKSQSLSFSYISEFSCNSNEPGSVKLTVDQPNANHIVENFLIRCGVEVFGFSLIRKGSGIQQLSIADWLRLDIKNIEKLEEMKLSSIDKTFHFNLHKGTPQRLNLEVTREISKTNFFRLYLTETRRGQNFHRDYRFEEPSPAEGVKISNFGFTSKKTAQELYSPSWWNGAREISLSEYDTEFLKPLKEKLKSVLGDN